MARKLKVKSMKMLCEQSDNRVSTEHVFKPFYITYMFSCHDVQSLSGFGQLTLAFYLAII